MPFLEHLEEFRNRIIKAIIGVVIGAIICLVFSKPLLNVLLWPTTQINLPIEIQVLKVQGMFVVTLEIAFFGGIILSLPFILYQMWMFVAPGLYIHERKYVPRIITSATILFLAGVAFAYFVIFPFALRFFLGLAPEAIKTNIAIDFYISFLIRLLIVFGIVFQLPIMSYFLSRLGILSPAFMRKYRKHSIVVIFVLAALFTPPDPLTQVLLAIPLVLLYELSIFISVAVYKGKAARKLEEIERKKKGKKETD
ncbi:MAG: twin-arginine translocase subunit TatC [Calditrichaeota bacterium]|nr:twin-arginine translocase subunit TatC [Calditrichota bacterium]RQV99277.1 MAG: twin-arginine translocase subunit TatC [Calditrichota bacterium]